MKKKKEKGENLAAILENNREQLDSSSLNAGCFINWYLN